MKDKRNCNNNHTPQKELKTISNQAFENCSSLLKVTIPQSVTKIGKSAFANCSYLSTLEIDNATTSIEDYAFSNCFSG